MKVLLGATAAIMLMAAPALAQTPPALPSQCAFTAAPTIPDGATATNAQMTTAREALQTWRTTRTAELAACNAAALSLQAQYQAAAAANNAAATETDATITRFTAENTAYNGRSTGGRRERGSSLTRPDH